MYAASAAAADRGRILSMERQICKSPRQRKIRVGGRKKNTTIRMNNVGATGSLLFNEEFHGEAPRSANAATSERLNARRMTRLE